MKKFILALTSLALFISFVACSGSASGSQGAASGAASTKATSAGDSGEKASITILMGKPEVASQFEEMLSTYTANTGVNVTMIPLAGQDAYEKMTSLYASGNAPTILMVGQEFGEFQDKFLDLTDTSFIASAGEGTTDFVTVDSKIYGAPVTVEAYGIIYNPAVVQAALGADFDPASIKTIDGLRAFFEGIKAKDAGAFTLSPMDWSLGAHLSNTIFTGQSDSHEERHAFLEDLKSGTVSLADSDVFNGWVDTLDLMLEYNIHAEAPLAPVYEDGSMDLATGEAASWFMGNWAYPELAAMQEEDYRFIPVPVSNNESDYANGKIAIGVPSYWCIDQSTNSEAQQQAAVDFLTWFITTPEGQEHYVNKLNFIPAYSNFTAEPADAMSAQIVEYLNSGNSLEWMNTYYPAGGFQAMGASMQKYIDGQIDRKGLATEIEDYWKTVK